MKMYSRKTRYLFVAAVAILIASPLRLLAADEQADYAAFIASLENLPSKEFSELVIAEINEYLRRFPDAANLDDMHFKVASIYWDTKQEVAAFFTSLQLLYLYPNSRHISVAQDRLRTLLIQGKKFEPLRDKTETILNPILKDNSKEGVSHTFLRDLREYNFEPVTKRLIAACDEFTRSFPNSAHVQEVLFWKAELLAKDQQNQRALAEYMKMTFLYKQSLHATASKLKMADLFTDKLDMHQSAILTLEEFLLEFPEDPQAPYAQLRMAKIIADKKKTYLEAVNAYTAVAKRYPTSVEAVPALFEAAKLYEEKFKEYDQAIRIYSEVVRDFPSDLKAPYALAEAARIYEKRLNDDYNAGNVYYKVYGSYPQSAIAPQSLFAAAEITEKRLKDMDKALQYYRLIVDQYSSHEMAAKASKRIEKLTKESNAK